MEGYIGEIRMFAGNFAPRSWELCQGQALYISEYDVLFAIIGTTYGGDGQQTFKVPNLSSRIPIGMGQGAGLSNYVLGSTGGTESNVLTVNNIGSHTHSLTGTAGLLISGEDGHKISPVNNVPAGNGELIYSSVTDSSVMAPATVSLIAASAGNPAPVAVNNMKPALVINFVICTEGIFPTQS